MIRFAKMYGTVAAVFSLLGITAGGALADGGLAPSVTSPSLSSSDMTIDYLTLPGDSLESVVVRAAERSEPGAVADNLRAVAKTGATFLPPSSPLTIEPNDLRSLAIWVESGHSDSDLTDLLAEPVSSYSEPQAAIPPPSGYNFWGAQSYERRAWIMNYEIVLASCGIFGCDVAEHHTFKHIMNLGNYITRFDTVYQRLISSGRVGRPSFTFAKWDGFDWNGSAFNFDMSPGSWSTTVGHDVAVKEEWAMETVETTVMIDGFTDVIFLHGGENYCIDPVKDPFFIPCLYADYSHT